jgi:hypothetical protein
MAAEADAVEAGAAQGAHQGVGGGRVDGVGTAVNRKCNVHDHPFWLGKFAGSVSGFNGIHLGDGAQRFYVKKRGKGESIEPQRHEEHKG